MIVRDYILFRPYSLPQARIIAFSVLGEEAMPLRGYIAL
jgi:hypothetical protein